MAQRPDGGAGVHRHRAEAKRIIQEFAPDVCVGTGGYVSGPVLREAAKLGIPCVIHESNAYPGVTTKMLAKSVKAVMLAVPDAKQYFDSLCQLRGHRQPGPGGGARRPAGGIPQGPGPGRPAGGALLWRQPGGLGPQPGGGLYAGPKRQRPGKYQHIHGYGTHDEKFLSDECREFGLDVEKNPQIRLLEYIDNMPQCLSAADLVIGRAGAMTLTEIEAKAKASILIPSPNVAENHQFHNAMALVRRGAAEILEEKDLTGEALWEKVRAILSDPGRLQSLGENAGKMEVLDASDRIYRVIKSAAAK